MMQWIKHHLIKLIKFCIFVKSTCFGRVCMHLFYAWIFFVRVKWEVARFLFFILILCSYFAFERTTHWARRREIPCTPSLRNINGLLLGKLPTEWAAPSLSLFPLSCPEGSWGCALLRDNPVWTNLKYTSNLCFDVSLRTLEVDVFFQNVSKIYCCFYCTIKNSRTATFIMLNSSVSTLLR